MSPVSLLAGAVGAILASATDTGTLRKANSDWLRIACLSEFVFLNKISAIDRLLWLVRQGQVGLGDAVLAVM